MSEQSRTLFHITLPGNDARDDVINRHLDTLGNRQKSQWAKDVLYRYIVGLLIPVQPNYTFNIPLEGHYRGKDWPITLKIRAIDEQRAQDQALEFMRDNYPDYRWQVQNGATQ